MKSLPLTTLLCTISALFASCSKAPARYGTGTEGRQKAHAPLVWQTAWVDPRIVTSDTVLTLFQAGRIDSLQVESGKAGQTSNGAVEFQIESRACDVEINLLDSRFRLVRHLMSTNLPAGYYKLTLNPGVAKRLIIAPGEYQISVRFCRKGISNPVSVN